MQLLEGRLPVSAHDLVGFLGCEHLMKLDQEVAEDRRKKPGYYEAPQLELLQKRGRDHERRCLERPAAHQRNAARSSEEARIVARAVETLLKEEWTDTKGKARRIRIEDILVVAPYNAQVGEIGRILKDQFGHGARVGTVDKVPGQEGAVVLCSMATSSPEDAPRRMGFLYSGYRFNVAVSRARGLAVLVCSPDLLKVRCRTPEEMRLANALCRFVEMSGERPNA